MSYEVFRSSVLERLSCLNFPTSQLNVIMDEIDHVATQYEIHRCCTDLIAQSDYPEVLKMYIASLAIESKSQGTLSNYLQVLKKFFSRVSKPYNMITTNDIRVYLFEYQEERNVKKSTLDHVRIVINSFFNWLVNQELIVKNPARLIDRIKYQTNKLPAMESIELEYFRDACETHQEKALVDFLASTGCRVSECASIILEDINWNDRSVLIRHGKGDKQRTVYFNAEAEVSMKNYIASKKHISKYLFSKSRAPYTGLTYRSIEEDIEAICKRVSGKLSIHVTPHTFRRTMATSLINNGMPIEEVKELLGHVKLDTTMRYITLSKKKVKASYDKYAS